MRFIDEVTIHAKAGDGGNGKVSFWREKYVTRGGPDGGDGGRGGHVIFRADRQLGTLMDLHFSPKAHAPNGAHGIGRMKNGSDGEDLVVRVPRGTQVFDEDSGKLLVDLVDPGQEFVLRGGRGGLGNVHFATSTRQAPDFAKPGREGEERRLRLSLKVLADVGVVGFPNAGKSTLLSVASAAHPKIADYPFTTLSPNLGVVKIEDGRTFVMADMPGLIEGASEGAGLGHRFLRHMERVRLLVHLIEGGLRSGRDDAIADYEIIRDELKTYNPALARLPEVVVLTKADLPETEDIRKVLEPYFKKKRRKLFVISAATRAGVPPLLKELADRVSVIRTDEAREAEVPGAVYHPTTVSPPKKKIPSRRRSGH